MSWPFRSSWRFSHLDLTMFNRLVHLFDSILGKSYMGTELVVVSKPTTRRILYEFLSSFGFSVTQMSVCLLSMSGHIGCFQFTGLKCILVLLDSILYHIMNDGLAVWMHVAFAYLLVKISPRNLIRTPSISSTSSVTCLHGPFFSCLMSKRQNKHQGLRIFHQHLDPIEFVLIHHLAFPASSSTWLPWVSSRPCLLSCTVLCSARWTT